MSKVAGEDDTRNFKKSSSLTNTKEIFTSILIWGATIFGVLSIGVAVYMPFYIKDTFLGTANYSSYSDLGPIGDYIGGTTVAILTAASVFLLLATIIMQRREIQISQRGIDELVKQTEASIDQAKEARKEVIVTNETMKRQQFESTFFNIINLHQKLGDKLQNNLVRDKTHDLIQRGILIINRNYDNNAGKQFKNSFDISKDFPKVKSLIEYLRNNAPYMVNHISIHNKNEVLEAFNEISLTSLISDHKENEVVKEFIEYAYSEYKEQVIREGYKEFFIEHKETYKSYYDSFNTIIKFLRDSGFETSDVKAGTRTNSVYREIFFSQLSSKELVFMYYYAVYNFENDWLKDELKTYNLFYPNLVESLLMFGDTDIKNIEDLSF